MTIDIQDDRDDTAVVLTDMDGPPVSNGKIVDELDMQGQPTGQKLFVPTEDEEKRMAERIGDELDIAEGEYASLFERMRANIDTFEALPSGDKEEILTLPVTKTAANYLIGFFVNRIWGKNPVSSVIPQEFGQYAVPMPVGQDPMTGETLSRVEYRSAEDLASGGESLMNSYLRDPSFKFHAFLHKTISNCVMGASPTWGKTCYERVVRPQLVPNWKRMPNGMVVIDGYREVDRVIGSPHKLVAQSGFNVMMASPWLDAQEAEWVGDHDPQTIAEGWNKVKNNEWYLVSDDEWKSMKKAVGDLGRYEHANDAAELQGRKVDRKRHFLDVWHVWLYWPIIFADDTGQDMQGIFSMLVPYERTTRKVLACPLNPYAHGRRNLVPYVQRPRPDDIAGYSTVEDAAPLQKVKTTLFHSQIQNAQLANTVYVKYRPGTTAAGWLKAGNHLRSRSLVPAANKDDFIAETLGREMRSLAPEIQAISAWEKELTISDTVKGATLLGRTSRAAISLVQEAGLTIPNMDLDFIRDRLGENLTMLYHNLGQWSVFGEEIPFADPVTRAVVMKAISFPLEGNGAFRVQITASSDEETAQFEFERDLGLAKLQGEKFMEAAQLIAPMVNPSAPPVVREFQKPMLVAQQLMLARILELARIDPKKYTFNEKQIDEILARHDQWVAAQQAKQQEEQIAIQSEAIRRANAGGGASVVQGSFGGGSVPPAQGTPNPQAAPGVGAGPGNPVVPGPVAGNGI